MNYRYLAALALVLLISSLAWYSVDPTRKRSAGELEIITGVSGPATTTPLPPATATAVSRFQRGGRSRLAVLLTDSDSAWLSLAHGLQTIGIPFRFTTDVGTAVQHPVVYAYPAISGRLLNGEALRALARHVRNGHTVIAGTVHGGLHELFGIDAVSPSRSRGRIELRPEHPLTSGFDLPAERLLPFARPGHDIAMGTHAYIAGRAAVVAQFEDRTGAIIERRFDSGGRALALGFDLGFLLQRAHGRRLEGVARRHGNAYAPSVDVLLRVLKRVYRAGQPDAVTLGVVPDARPLAMIFTHDIDSEVANTQAPAFARAARERGLTSTFFVQTKYVDDWNGVPFLRELRHKGLQQLAAQGMEVASHSVSHSPDFASLAPGDGSERYPTYRPVVLGPAETRDATVLGELRVSRFLLEALNGGAPVRSFRSGHLAYPDALPEALLATGYRFSSSMLASTALTHLPFALTAQRAGRAAVPVFEFPVTLEDELPPALAERVADALTLARRIARHGGMFLVLIHPDRAGDKLDLQNRLADTLATEAWTGSLSEFGAWWATRAQVAIEVTGRPDGSIKVEITTPEAIRQLALELPRGRTLAPLSPGGTVERTWPGGAIVALDAGRQGFMLKPASP
ncbi:MAG: polysaccharide deacetylase family protein [Pseudomonadota bacterium]